MKRKNKIIIPDAINFGISRDFTAIPNNVIRNPNLTSKAKTVLCLLLSNKSGWKTYKTTILEMMSEGETALNSALTELEKNEYLIRVTYRCAESKKIVGSFWAYTDTPGKFDIKEQLSDLGKNGYEAIISSTLWKPTFGLPKDGKPGPGNPELIILSKKTNGKKTKVSSSEADKLHEPITKSMFERFWKAYPRKTDKGKALTKWNTLCGKPPKERPTWFIIRKAIFDQKKTERWSEPDFIPLAATWLNQSRWLDDPNEMKIFRPKVNGAPRETSRTGVSDEEYTPHKTY